MKKLVCLLTVLALAAVASGEDLDIVIYDGSFHLPYVSGPQPPTEGSGLRWYQWLFDHTHPLDGQPSARTQGSGMKSVRTDGALWSPNYDPPTTLELAGNRYLELDAYFYGGESRLGGGSPVYRKGVMFDTMYLQVNSDDGLTYKWDTGVNMWVDDVHYSDMSTWAADPNTWVHIKIDLLSNSEPETRIHPFLDTVGLIRFNFPVSPDFHARNICFTGAGAANTPPVVDAGEDQITLATESVTLDGSVIDDGLPYPPGVISITWEQVSGPAPASFGDATAASTTVTFSAIGVYQFRLTADDGEFSESDTVQVTVEEPAGAYWPSPADSEEHADRDGILQWESGSSPMRVYFGQSWEDVNDGVMAPDEVGSAKTITKAVSEGETYCWRVDAYVNSAWAKGDVWSFTVDDGKASELSPRNLVKDIDLQTTLSWVPGRWADSHYVYIGRHEREVATGTGDVTIVHTDVNEYIPGVDGPELTYSGVYYWRVDANEPSKVIAGDVHRFSTTEYFEVEPFNDFTTSSGGWVKDGYGTVVKDEFEASDGNSVRIEYYPRLNISIYRSCGVRHEFDTAQDWSAANGGVVSIAFETRGDPNNDPYPFYVTIDDGTASQTVWSDSLQPNASGDIWSLVNFDLGLFTQVNLSNVMEVAVGVGNNTEYNGPYDTEVETVWIDNLRLYGLRCLPGILTGDLNDDCVVSEADLELFARDWLFDPYNVPDISATEPQAPVLYYSFDAGCGGVVEDHSGNDYDGTAYRHVDDQGNDTDVLLTSEDPWDPIRRNPSDSSQSDPYSANYIWDADPWLDADGFSPSERIGRGCISGEVIDQIVDGWSPNYTGTIVDVPAAVFNDNIVRQITISVWIAGDPCEQPASNWRRIFDAAPANPDYREHILMGAVPDPGGTVAWTAGVPSITGGTDALMWDATSEPDAWRAQEWLDDPVNTPDDDPNHWNHYAFVKNSTTGMMRIYCNGDAVANTNERFERMEDIAHFHIGTTIDGWNHVHVGKIDEFKVFDYALSEAEVMHLAGIEGSRAPYEATGSSDADWSGDNKVDFVDFAHLANRWLDTALWPE